MNQSEICAEKTRKCGCQGPQPSVGSYKVELSPPNEIYEGDEFAVIVTAMSADAKALVTGWNDGTDTLSLNDTSAFATSGTGILVSGRFRTKFTWTGKSGNDLTGVTQSLPAVADRDEAYASPAPDTGYSGSADVSAQAAGQPVALTDTTIASGNWDNGVAVVRETVNNSPSSSDVDMDVTVQEQSTPGTGRQGSARAILKKKVGYFLVEVPAEITSGVAFTMTVTAFDKDNEVEDSYAQDCTITEDGAGGLDVTSIGSGDWSSGVYTTASQKYTQGASEKTIRATVTEDGGTKTGYDDMMISPTKLDYSTLSVFEKYYNSTLFYHEPAWNTGYVNCVAASPTVSGGNSYGVGQGELQVNVPAPSTDTVAAMKHRKYLRFDISSVKGNVIDARLTFTAKSNRRMHWEYDSTTYYEYDGWDLTIGVYSLDLGSSPSADNWDAWEVAEWVCDFRASTFAPEPDETSYSDRMLKIPSDVINDLSGDYLGLLFVDYNEKVDCPLECPDKYGASSQQGQDRWLLFWSSKLYVTT